MPLMPWTLKVPKPTSSTKLRSSSRSPLSSMLASGASVWIHSWSAWVAVRRFARLDLRGVPSAPKHHLATILSLICSMSATTFGRTSASSRPLMASAHSSQTSSIALVISFMCSESGPI